MTLGLLIFVFGIKLLTVVLCGLFVRIQLAVHRGFDLSLAVIVVCCAEIFIFLSNYFLSLLHGWAVFVIALLLTAMIGAAAGLLWNLALITLVRHAREPGYIVFLFSLGLSTLAAGLVGLLRGPGLRLIEDSMFTGLSLFQLPPAPFLACVLLLAAGIMVSVWIRHRAGFATSLLAQDRSFAIELGVNPSRIAVLVGTFWGGILAILASAQALLAGNTPESGLPLFLLGAVAALLFPNSGLVGPVLGGILVGFGLVLVQFVLPPSWAEPAVLMIAFAVIAARGIDRAAMGLR
jgi:branched-subunit amino acid ABC-type transport system permease component